MWISTKFVPKSIGMILEPLGAIFERLRMILEPLGAILERLGMILEPLGAILEPLGMILEPMLIYSVSFMTKAVGQTIFHNLANTYKQTNKLM